MTRTGVYGLVAGAAPSAAVKSPETGQTVSEEVWGRRCWLELVNKVRRTRWQDSSRENGTEGGRTEEGVLRAGRVTPARNPGRGGGGGGGGGGRAPPPAPPPPTGVLRLRLAPTR
jgi:hypothetical protein